MSDSTDDTPPERLERFEEAYRRVNRLLTVWDLPNNDDIAAKEVYDGMRLLSEQEVAGRIVAMEQLTKLVTKLLHIAHE